MIAVLGGERAVSSLPNQEISLRQIAEAALRQLFFRLESFTPVSKI